ITAIGMGGADGTATPTWFNPGIDSAARGTVTNPPSCPALQSITPPDPVRIIMPPSPDPVVAFANARDTAWPRGISLSDLIILVTVASIGLLPPALDPA
ncbi:hypothetical protein BCR44DRAFT_1429777, partial [Catenaria anguillulae PL171]